MKMTRCRVGGGEDLSFPSRFNSWSLVGVWELGLSVTFLITTIGLPWMSLEGVEGWENGKKYSYQVTELVPDKQTRRPIEFQGYMYKYDQVFRVQSNSIHVQGENFGEILYDRFSDTAALVNLGEKKCFFPSMEEIMESHKSWRFGYLVLRGTSDYQLLRALHGPSCDPIVAPMELVLSSGNRELKAIRLAQSLAQVDWKVDIKKAQALDLLFRLPKPKPKPMSMSMSMTGESIEGNIVVPEDSAEESDSHFNFLRTREETLHGRCPVTYGWKPVSKDGGNLKYFNIRPDAAPPLQNSSQVLRDDEVGIPFSQVVRMARSSNKLNSNGTCGGGSRLAAFLPTKLKAIKEMEEREDSLTPEMFRRAVDLCNEMGGQVVEVEKRMSTNNATACYKNEKGDPPSLTFDPNWYLSDVKFRNHEGMPASNPDMFGEETLVYKYLVCKIRNKEKKEGGGKSDGDLVTLYQQSFVVHRLRPGTQMTCWMGEESKGLRRTMTLISISNNPYKDATKDKIENPTTISSFASTLGPINYVNGLERSKPDRRVKFWIV